MPDLTIYKCFDDCGNIENGAARCRWAYGVDLSHIGFHLGEWLEEDTIRVDGYCPACGDRRNGIRMKRPDIHGEPRVLEVPDEN